MEKSRQPKVRIRADRDNRRCAIAVCSVAAVLTFALPAGACETPVFRYALVNWPADPYQVVIFHREKLDDSQQRLVARLKEIEQNVAANLIVDVVDLGGQVEPSMRELWNRQREGKLPRMVVTYPFRRFFGQPDAPLEALPPTIRTSPVKVADAKRLVQSPLRDALVKRLLGGHSAVWVLVECGDGNADDAAAKTLTEQLDKMPAVLAAAGDVYDQLPETQPGEGPQEEKLEIKFSLLRVSAKDPAEQALVAMLLGTEADLADRVRNEPIAFPVFGRGRILTALVGKGITAQNIEQVCTFINGPCSCEIKDENPGVDMLIAAPWDSILASEEVGKFELPPLFDDLPPDAEAETADMPAAAPARTGGSLTLLWGMLAGAAGLVVAVVISARILEARRRRNG
jgi:hypothetical protein